MEQKTLILALIKDNLKNVRLLNGLQKLGFGCEHYFLHLPDLVTQLMEISFEDDEELGNYICYFDKVDEIDFDNSSELEILANEIYDYLLTLKKE
jgi:hypothetical protein